MSQHAVFPLHLGGCISWWVYALTEKIILLDAGAYFAKQSYHNRLYIFSANGKLALSVPTVGGNFHKPLHSVEISYDHIWQPKLIQALQSAYGSSPYYSYYNYLLEPVLLHKYRYLYELSVALTQWIDTQLKTNLLMSISQNYSDCTAVKDYRHTFDAKHHLPNQVTLQRYPQIFELKHGFTPDLSILDLLFNLGPDAKNYLHSHSRFLVHG